MKSLLTIIIFIGFTLAAQNSYSQSKEEEKQARYEQIKALIESGKFDFQAQFANPQRGARISLAATPNFLKIDGQNATADLPYFGRAFNAGYAGGDGGVVFDNTMENYEVKPNDKKRKVVISFKVKGKHDNYTCTLTISTYENVTLSVISNKRQSISYLGSVKPLEENNR